MRHVSARTQPHSVAPHHIRSSSKIRFFFDFFAHPRFLRTLARPPQTNAPSHPPSHTSAKPLFLGRTPYFALWAQYGLWLRYCPEWGNTLRISPYFAIAQYGLWLRYCPEWGNTLRISPYLAPWAQYGLLSSRGCAPLHPGLYSGAPSGRSRQARAKSITSAVGIFAFVCHFGNP